MKLHTSILTLVMSFFLSINVFGNEPYYKNVQSKYLKEEMHIGIGGDFNKDLPTVSNTFLLEKELTVAGIKVLVYKNEDTQNLLVFTEGFQQKYGWVVLHHTESDKLGVVIQELILNIYNA
ncbi:hypothetical protein KMW28_20060 [Flammeovirga yaeyamensis]|uniref:Uncharacterized protein n=2 Tax=Flammeovirga TaxID=59739 RepID=A0AAX1N2X9_9BACT|nr:hypothetical protein [Flammeovirga yaeyamensis]MBB3701038.1 hypothetical protein [Flammeovirga yaeyamensis]NMF38129.1 hypothetical protein [Flammeovirga yaeyamensis]QWG01900.1 hypothetical protein KMW28_20060 [Flammeovirga yaeyamensis]